MKLVVLMFDNVSLAIYKCKVVHVMFRQHVLFHSRVEFNEMKMSSLAINSFSECICGDTKKSHGAMMLC